MASSSLRAWVDGIKLADADSLLLALHDLGAVEVAHLLDLEELPEEMLAELTSSLKPLERIRFKRALKAAVDAPQPDSAPSTAPAPAPSPAPATKEEPEKTGDAEETTQLQKKVTTLVTAHQRICEDFARGKCDRLDCKFPHIQACVDFMKGKCTRRNCLFDHITLIQAPGQSRWHTW